MLKISVEVVSLGKDKCSVTINIPEEIELNKSDKQEQECVIKSITQLKKY